jgi:hypothetical protein
MQSMMSCLGGCSAIAHRGRLLRRKETRLPSISLQVLDFVSGYLSLMSLAVSIPRMRSLYKEVTRRCFKDFTY